MKTLWPAALLLAIATPARPQAILVYDHGALEARAPGEPLSPDGDRRLKHVWRWSESSAPRRITAEDFGKDPPQDRQRLSVRLAHREERLKPGYRLLAAPMEMWTEIPELMLPAWDVPSDAKLEIPLDTAGSWRLRLLGPGQGSWWVDVPAGRRTAVLTPMPAEDRALWILDAEGEALPGASFTMLAEGAGRRGVLAQARTDGAGEIELRSLPDDSALQVVVSAKGFAPAALTARPSTLPGEVRLRPGATLRGRFVDPRDKPLAGVEVRADAWISARADATVARRDESDASGEWSLTALPPGKVAVAAEASGFSVFTTEVEVGAEGLDLGTVELHPGKVLPVVVVDDLGTPVAGARVEAGPRSLAFTDARGAARLQGLPAAAPVRVAVRAQGHVAAEKTVPVPFPEEARLEIRRAFRVEGRYLDADGLPVQHGTVRVEQGSRYDDRELTGGGRIALDLEPGVEVRLVMRSPSTSELGFAVAPGAAGELRDLGDLRAPAGVTVRGLLLHDRDLSPVPGARVWTPRPSENGDVVAWAQGDLLATRSTVEGAFELRGLPRRPILLRIDAPGLARAHLHVDPQDRAVIDLGEATLSAGATVRIFSGQAENAVARVDLRNQWLELDMLTADFTDSDAVVRHVPPGSATVTVLDGRRLLCEEQIEIAEGEDLVEVDCLRAPMRVSGRVLVGGEPAGVGLLTWMPEDSGQVPAIIMNHDTRLGVRRQETFGGGKPQVDVEVDGGGFFHSDELLPGHWQVHWLPTSGSSTPPEPVELPKAEDYELRLEFGGMALAGFVVDEEERPVAGARVRQVEGSALAFSSSNGSFSLVGLAPGHHRLFARFETRTSEVADAVITPEGDSQPLLLRLRADADEKVEVLVLDGNGEPAAGAFVFVEGLGQNGRILTTDLDGKAAAAMLPPYPQQLRVAKVSDGQWAFGPWLGLEAAARGVTLATERTGSLRLANSENHRGTPVILSDDGWDLSWLLTRLGNRPTLGPGESLEISGLPEGRYTVELDGARTEVAVKAGDQVDVELP